MTKLNSSSESNSEQNEDSNEGCSTWETECSDTARTGVAGEPALTRVNLCSSSSADKVGRGGNWKADGAVAARSSTLALKSPGLMNSTLGWVKATECAIGELGEGEGVDEEEFEVEAERGPDAWLAEPGRENTGINSVNSDAPVKLQSASANGPL